MHGDNGKENRSYYLRFKVRPMINEPAAFKGTNIRIPAILPINVRGLMNHGCGLSLIMPIPP